MTKYSCLGKKIALIIGGSSGIGLATAKILSENRCHVIVVGNQDRSVSKARQELAGKYTSFYKVDATDSDALRSLVVEIREKFGKIDYLVNCIGGTATDKKAELNESNFDYLMNVNAKSVYLSHMILGYPLLNKNGAVVNVSSVFGRKGTPTSSVGYAAAKAAVINMTKTFALEMAPQIRVNCVAPGATYPTGISHSWSEDFRKSIAANIPLGRLAGPAEIASVIVFLLSDDASYITGQTLDVNGGNYMN